MNPSSRDLERCRANKLHMVAPTLWRTMEDRVRRQVASYWRLSQKIRSTHKPSYRADEFRLLA
jgi:hypothetical protein